MLDIVTFAAGTGKPRNHLSLYRNQPIRLPGLKPGAGLPSPGPGKAGAGVFSGLILSGAFTPIYKSGFGAVERINPLIVRERHSLQIGFDEPPALGNADELVTPTYLHLFIKYVYMSSNVRSLLI